MSPEELINLSENYTYKFNEWSEKHFPKRFKEKFNRILNKETKNKKDIMGRVT